MPRRRTRVHLDAARALAAPGALERPRGGGVRRPVVEAAAMRSAVSMAVPDGASIFWSWWSSMISAVSKNGAAISAKRIISTAPMAKLGAMTQLLVVNRLARGRGRRR